MRIISGKFKGRVLTKSDHLKALRPTTDKNRESLFNILFSAKSLKEIGFKLENSNVLDVCCGTGAVAFEALSRGAKTATLIDNNRQHLEIAKKNCEILGVENEVKIFCYDAKNLPQNSETFDLIFIDPPYCDKALEILNQLLNKNFISKNSLIVIETKLDKNHTPINLSKNFILLDERAYGKTKFIFLRLI